MIKEFVNNQQSFISLDVYCKLGTHFDTDSNNPIHEQVRAAYSTALMPNYLCKWVRLRLEGGGFANCWKYYLPKVSKQKYYLPIREDGRIELTKKILGTFSLLECDLGVHIGPNKILYKLINNNDVCEDHIESAANHILISPNMLKEAGLYKENLVAYIYPNRIEVMKEENNE